MKKTLMRHVFPCFCVLLIMFAGCAKAPEPASPGPPVPRVFGPNEIRPKVLFVGAWQPAKRGYLNVQLEVVKAKKGEPATLTNAEVNEDFFPTITAVFVSEEKELSRQDLTTERSC